jgi:hypothetical protein
MLRTEQDALARHGSPLRHGQPVVATPLYTPGIVSSKRFCGLTRFDLLVPPARERGLKFEDLTTPIIEKLTTPGHAGV